MSEAKVGEQAVLALDDAVLLVAEGGGLEPLGAVLHVDVALFFEQLDAAGHQAGVVERLLGIPDFEFDAEFLEVVAAVFELLVERMLMNVVPVAAEQLLGLGDQRIEMQFALLSWLRHRHERRPAGPACRPPHRRRHGRICRHGRPSSAWPSRAHSRPGRHWAGKARSGHADRGSAARLTGRGCPSGGRHH